MLHLEQCEALYNMFMRRLCILVINNTNYVQCDFETSYLCVWKVPITFHNVIIGGIRWLDLENHLCHLFDVHGQVDSSLTIVLTRSHCMLCGQYTRVAIMLIYAQCSKCCHMPSLEEILVGKWFYF
jgi:hypothetical protein